MAGEFVKNKSAKVPTNIDPLHIFITGKGGCGKSNLLKTIFFSLTKTLSYHTAESKQKVLLLAPTGVAAININGTTINSALKIPVGRFEKNVPQLSDKLRSSLRNKLSELQVIIIDEVSWYLIFCYYTSIND